MVFEKKLIILSGERSAKGTLTLERNAYGMFAVLNLYNLPDLSEGEYCAGLRSGERYEVRRLGTKGRILDRFAVELTDLSAVHCVVFDSVRELALLYGTNTPAKLWPGNMMDGFRRKQDEAKKEIAKETETLPSYSGRGNEIRDYFFDITPGERIEVPQREELALSDGGEQSLRLEAGQAAETERSVAEQNPQDAQSLSQSARSLLETARNITAEYNDSALAEVNYYDNPVTYSSIEDVDTDALVNPIDRYMREKEPPVPTVQSIREAVREKPETNMQATIQKKSETDTENTVQEKTEHDMQGTMRDISAAKSLKAAPPLYAGEAAFTVPPVSTYAAGDSAAKVRPQTVFYEQIKAQIDGLFADGERFTLLESLMEDTRWVRVNYDEKRFYAVGLIGSRPDYICYAVPAEFSATPPEELGDNCKWLPENPASPEGKGFWLMFQDAVTGSAI